MPKKTTSHHLQLPPPEQLLHHLTTPDMIINGGEELEHAFSNPDIMGLVFTCLNDSVTRLRFSAVCRSWRCIARSCCALVPPQFPWLMLYTDVKDGKRLFFSLSDGATHTLHLPEAQGFYYSGYLEEGWLFLQTKGDIFLLHILSRSKIHLPIMATDTLADPEIVPMPHIYNFFMGSIPISNDGAKDNNNQLVVAYDFKHNLYLCRLGDQSWTRQHGLPENFSLDHFIFYNGSLIAIECAEEMTVVEMVLELDHTLKFKVKIHSLPFPILPGTGGGDDNSNLPLPMLPSTGDDDDNVDYEDIYHRLPELVEWRGELYLLFHERHLRSTVGFYLYKLDSKLKSLAKVESLGDGMIFLLNGRPKCFSVNDFPPSLNLRGNCIYYIIFHRLMVKAVTANVFCLEEKIGTVPESDVSALTIEDVVHT